MLTFKASAVSAVALPETGTFVVALAEEPDGRGRRLEIQRGRSFDEQDRQLGMDTYSLSNERGATVYGGVASWELTAGTLVIILEEKAATVLEVGGGFVIHVDANEEMESALRLGMKRVLNTLD